MDKAQEKIAKLIREKPHIYSCLYVHSTEALSKEILLLLGELGYRKLPKDKLPLLSDEEMLVALNQYPTYRGAVIDLKGWDTQSLIRVAIAQREADIKFYEGK